MNSNSKRIYLSSPTMHGEELDFIHEAIESNWVAPLGPNVDAFERELADHVRIPFATALVSGTAAIHLALKLCGVGLGDVVFCSSLTFSASANPITYEGGIPVFIDSEQDTWNMDPAALEKAFAQYPKAKAVILANLYGTPARLPEIKAVCEARGIPLIEDAAESLGALCEGQATGTFGDFGIFSFNGNKIITSSGGGMLVSKKEKHIQKAKFWATQSRENARHYEHREIGYNYRMSNVVAGIGRGQLRHLDEHVSRKKAIYEFYANAFADIPEIKMNPFRSGDSPNYWLSCATIDPCHPVKPLDIILALEKENIESRPIWKPMHLQPVFKDCNFVQVCPGTSVSQKIYETGLCLPSDIKNTKEDMARIVGIIRRLFE
jgi:dTDP-4-amino-4,6-dideoxygalactose transaminase